MAISYYSVNWAGEQGRSSEGGIKKFPPTYPQKGHRIPTNNQHLKIDESGLIGLPWRLSEVEFG